MKRREFLKTTGIASVALATLLLITALGNVTRVSAQDNQRGFTFDVRSALGSNVIIINGDGVVSSSGVEGGGSFTIFTDTGSAPKPIVAFGTWKATSLVSFTEIGTYGAHAAGTLVMDVVLTLADGTEIPGTMTFVCNLGPAGLFTGSTEGVTLAAGTLGTFTPTTAGLTVFSTQPQG